jgi:protein O-mannosyl-transferase
LPVWQIVAAVAILAIISAAVFLGRRRCPYLLAGWLWYLVMLVPVIGFLQFGITSVADRFMYLPQIGLVMALTWGAADLCGSQQSRRWLCGIASGLVLAVSMGAAYRQTSFWRDSENLWNHALQCTSRNGVAHTNIGVLLADEGRFGEATAHFQQAIDIFPNDALPYYHMGRVAMLCGNSDKAEYYLSRALKINPRYAPTYNRLGLLFFSHRQFDKAISFFEKSLAINSSDPEVWYDLGRSLKACGRCDEAQQVLRAAADIAPGYAPSHNTLGLIMARRGRFVEAIESFQKAIDVAPDYVDARINLAGVLAEKGCWNESAAQYNAVLRIDPNNVEARKAIARIRAGRSAPPRLAPPATSERSGKATKSVP